MTDERNPNHPVTSAAREQWHKIAALIMVKLGVDRLVITHEDINGLEKRPGGTNIVVLDGRDALVVELVTDAEGERLARGAGGLAT